MNIPSDLIGKMVAAAIAVVQNEGTKDLQFVETQVKDLARIVEEIAKEVEKGMSPDEAKQLLQQQLLLVEADATIVEEMAKLLSQQAINAALDILKGFVNDTLHFALIP